MKGGYVFMYAIIEAGGKQFKVEENTVLRVEFMNKAENDTVRFDKVILVCDDGKISVGKAVEKAYAEAVVVKNGKGPKINIFKYKAKKNERKRQGHRQPYTEIKITKIAL